jgi:hypothetical protein
MGITESFVGILDKITPSNLPIEGVEAARRLILDGLAVAVAGSREKALQNIAAHLVNWRRATGDGHQPGLQTLDGISRLHQRCGNACARLRADVAAAESCDLNHVANSDEL